MKKILFCALIFAAAAVFSGCGVQDMDNVPAQIVTGGTDGTMDTEAASPIDMKVRLGWARAERFKIVGTKGYHSLFGIVRVELVSNRSQTVIVHYSTNGRDWLDAYGKDSGLTDDGNFRKFYFHTPTIVAETNLVGKVVYQFRVEYRVDGETNMISDNGVIFKASSNPGKNLPDGVIGQGAPGYWHILLENADLTPVYSTEGTLLSNIFHGHIQVKNEGPGLAKAVRIVYRYNTTGWDETKVQRYPYGLAFKTDKSFYSNNYKFGIEHWEFSVPVATNTQYVQFILQVQYIGANMFYDDKNRCKRYWIKTIPGVMISYATN